jgi:hypothetical protein
MNPAASPAELARAWLDLAEQETEAIQQENWHRLAACQQQIAQLQQQWEKLLAPPEPTQSTGVGTLPDPEIRHLLAALLERERFNQQLLQQRRSVSESEFQQLTRAAWNLRRLHSARSGPPTSGWSHLS